MPVVTLSDGPGLSLTEWVVLALLAEEPSHGFAVARTLSPSSALGQVWIVPPPAQRPPRFAAGQRGGISTTTLVDFTVATAITPGASSSSSAASRLISETTR